jgi:hypothetical protein
MRKNQTDTGNYEQTDSEVPEEAGRDGLRWGASIEGCQVGYLAITQTTWDTPSGAKKGIDVTKIVKVDIKKRRFDAKTTTCWTQRVSCEKWNPECIQGKWKIDGNKEDHDVHVSTVLLYVKKLTTAGTLPESSQTFLKQHLSELFDT